MFFKRFGDAVLGAIVIILCVVLLTQTFGVKTVMNMPVTASEWARVILYITMATSLAIMIRGIIAGLKMKPEERTAEQKQADKRKVFATLISMISIVVCIVIMPYVGFIISMVLYLAISFYCYVPREKWNHILMIGMSVGIPVVVYFLFTKVMRILLPVGSIIKDLLN